MTVSDLIIAVVSATFSVTAIISTHVRVIIHVVAHVVGERFGRVVSSSPSIPIKNAFVTQPTAIDFGMSCATGGKPTYRDKKYKREVSNGSHGCSPKSKLRTGCRTQRRFPTSESSLVVSCSVNWYSPTPGRFQQRASIRSDGLSSGLTATETDLHAGPMIQLRNASLRASQPFSFL